MQVRLSAIILLCLPTVATAADPSTTPAKQRTVTAATNGQSASSADDTPADRAVERQVDAIQRQISLEERKLEARMAQLANHRKVALEKTDAAQLKRIEQLEQQAIQAYEQQLQRIIRSAAIKGSSQSPGAANSSPRAQRAGSRPSAPKQSRRSAPSQRQASRFRLLPF